MSADSMHALPPRFRSAGDSGLVVAFEERIGPDVLARVVALDAAVRTCDVAGIVETVPTYRALLILLDPLVTDAPTVEAAVRRLMADLPAAPTNLPNGRLWHVPVCYGGPNGADFDAVAARVGLSAEGLRDLHAGAEYTVYMIGFAPGFAYLGGLPDRLHLSRRDDPRLKVPAGSVAIGGQQAAVFSVEMPSGWHLLGRTPERAFAPDRRDPFLFAQGDRIRFAPIDDATFDALAARAASGEIVARVEAAS
jgi:5-oxoprolinase (ATP-hydrolysing) subunit B